MASNVWLFQSSLAKCSNLCRVCLLCWLANQLLAGMFNSIDCWLISNTLKNKSNPLWYLIFHNMMVRLKATNRILANAGKGAWPSDPATRAHLCSCWPKLSHWKPPFVINTHPYCAPNQSYPQTSARSNFARSKSDLPAYRTIVWARRPHTRKCILVWTVPIYSMAMAWFCPSLPITNTLLNIPLSFCRRGAEWSRPLPPTGVKTCTPSQNDFTPRLYIFPIKLSNWNGSKIG